MGRLLHLQKKFAFLPDYNFTKPEAEKEEPPHAAVTTSQAAKPESKEKKTAGSKLGTSVAGLTGGLLTLGLAFIIGLILKKSVGIPSDQ